VKGPRVSAGVAVAAFGVVACLLGLSDSPGRAERAADGVPAQARFAPNVGQAPEAVRFVGNAGPTSLELSDDAAALTIPAAAGGASTLRFRFLDGAARSPLHAEGRLPGVSNYFLGSDPSRWATRVPGFAAVRQSDVYPGIDVRYRGARDGGFEYDLLAKPGSDPSSIRIGLSNRGRLALDRAGDLLIPSAGGTFRQAKPIAYQSVGGKRRLVPVGYALRGAHEVGFLLGRYDPSRELTIDPVLSWSTYLGGSSYEDGSAVTTDAQGNVYVTGVTYSTDFPTTPGAFQRQFKTIDVFVSKFDPTGSSLIYSTYLGGHDYEESTAIAVDGAGSAYVTGWTESDDFPTTPGAFQRRAKWQDAFLTKLDPSGSSLVYSTRLGGENSRSSSGGSDDYGLGVAVDSSGRAFVFGDTTTRRFPVTDNAFQRTFHGWYDSFVAKFDSSGSALLYSTYIGGTGFDWNLSGGLDARGHAFLVGETTSGDFPATASSFQMQLNGYSDLYVAKFSADGRSLAYATYLGGSGTEGEVLEGGAIALDANGRAVVTGTTRSNDFPVTKGAFQRLAGGGEYDGFVAAFNGSGGALRYSTYLGGSAEDEGLDVAVDDTGRAYALGYTASSADFPTVNALQPTYGGGPYDAYLTVLAPDGKTAVTSTFLGSTGDDEGAGVAVAADGSVLLTGSTDSTTFPTTPGAYQQHNAGEDDAFVSRVVLP